MKVYLRRLASFSAAHNYWLPELTETENHRRFGVWANQEGHGHNYQVQVTVAGEVDEHTGMVVNITDVNVALKKCIVDALDGKFLNRELPYFRENASTVENISQWAWSALEPQLPQGCQLVAVKIWEMETLWGSLELDRVGTMITRLTRAYDFSASHRLHSKDLSEVENTILFGKCNNPNGHGHNYGVEVTLEGHADPATGMLFPLGDLDKIVEDEVLLPFDHKHLNLDTPEFVDINPTSEMLTVVIWKKLEARLQSREHVRLASVIVRETARNSFEYRGE
jgi:6-pyruvoyltetrahydropterin/6-carboxytetrahydropterin synthase